MAADSGQTHLLAADWRNWAADCVWDVHRGRKASRGAGSGSASVGQPKHDAEGFNGAGAAGAGIFPADRRQVYNGGQQDDSKFKKPVGYGSDFGFF